MIGIRLRATGHTKEQIRDAMEAVAPEIRKELGSAGTHPWPEYSARTANYVFSYNGDKAMKDKERWFSDWKKVEQGIFVEKAAPRQWKPRQIPERKDTSKSSGMEM
jgi:hypothetical protein